MDDLQKKIQMARAAGYSDAEIQQYVSSRQPKTTPTPTTPVQPKPVAPAPQEQKARESLLSTIGHAVVDPAVNYAKFAGAGLIQAPVLAATQGKVNIPIMSDQELVDAGSGNLGKAALQGAKRTAGMEAYLMPGGIQGGAAAGALSGFAGSKEGQELTDAAGGAVLGGAVGGVVKGLGKVAKAVTGNGGENALEKAGSRVRQGVSKIYTDGSVWGAEREKAVQTTLNKLGIKGSSQQQYEQLAPAFEQLTQQIDQHLAQNPKVVNNQNIVDTFMTKIKGALRTKELDANQAKTEIAGYLQDLGNLSGETGEISTKDLFALKKMVNEDYQGVIAKMRSDKPLNAREKVIASARDTLDEIIAQAHPEVKDATIRQSHLYDAAESLNKSRKTIPTVRGPSGFTIPAEPAQAGVDAIGRGLQNAGGAVKNMGGVVQGLADVGNAVQSPGIVAATGLAKQPVPQSNQVENGIGNENKSPNINSNLNHTSTLPDPSELVQSPSDGLTPEMVDQSIMQALSEGNTKLANSLMSFKSSKFSKGSTRLPATQAQGLGDLQGSLDLMDGLNNVIDQYADTIGPVKGRLGSSNPYNTRSQAFQSQMKAVAQNVGKALEGGVLRAEDVPKYEAILPNINDTREVALAKIANVKQLLMTQMQARKSTFKQSGYDPENPTVGNYLPDVTNLIDQ